MASITILKIVIDRRLARMDNIVMCSNIIYFQRNYMARFTTEKGVKTGVGSFLLSLATAGELCQYNGQGRNKKGAMVQKKGFSIHYPHFYKAMQGQFNAVYIASMNNPILIVLLRLVKQGMLYLFVILFFSILNFPDVFSGPTVTQSMVMSSISNKLKYYVSTYKFNNINIMSVISNED